MLSRSELSKNTTTNTSHVSAGATPLAYARMRRWLGIAYVGMVVTACTGSLIFALASKFLSVTSQAPLSLVAELGSAFLIFSLCSLPFDIAGFNIERLCGRTKLSLSAFLSKQIGASFRYGLIVLAMAACISLVWGAFALTGLVLASVFLSLCLLASQLALAKFYGRFRSEPAADANKSVPLVLLQSEERCFSGGIVGLPGLEKIVIPKRWFVEFSPAQLAAELSRRNLIISSGGRLRGVLLAVVFTNIGILLAAALTSMTFLLPLNSAAGLATMSQLFTLWSFVGLLILPSFSHSGVYEADRLAIESGVSREVMLQTITQIDVDLEDEQERTPAVDSIFHPVPTVAHRLFALEHPRESQKKGAWQAARYTIFLSVIGLSLLGRAVHCNAGKPELWAMLPAD